MSGKNLAHKTHKFTFPSRIYVKFTRYGYKENLNGLKSYKMCFLTIMKLNQNSVTERQLKNFQTLGKKLHTLKKETRKYVKRKVT